MPHLARRQDYWAGVALALVLSGPASAWAQNSFCAAEAACTVGISTSSATTIVGVGATMLTRINTRKIAALGQYVVLNRPAVLSALALGAGEALTDLAALCGVREEDLLVFCASMRARRAEFVHADDARYLGSLVLRIAEE